MEATTRSNRKACDRIELNLRKDAEINGEAFMLATPSRIHREISIAIAAQLYNFLEGKQCKVYPAPFAVRLFEQDVAKVNVLNGCFIELSKVFSE